MKSYPFLLVFLLSCLSSTQVNAQLTIEGTEIDTHTVIHGLDIPWEMVWGTDDHIWVTERYGIVSRIHPTSGDKDIILDLTASVEQQGESGLLGMALHPNFPTDDRVYLVYTYESGLSIKERLVSFQYQNGWLMNETILIDEIPGNTTHDGSRLVFGPDDKLYMTTGDAQNTAAPQDRNSLLGKVLRINPDGSIPNDNPFGSYVWSTGHRNAQGLFFHDGILYSSEHGPSNDDEINIIQEGRNYGWPNVHGFCNFPSEITFCNDSNVVEPLISWTPTLATSDIAIYDHDAIEGLKGKLLLTTLKEQDVRVMSLNEAGDSILSESTYFNSYWGRLRDLLISPDGRVFIATNGFSWGEAGTFRHDIIEIRNPSIHGIEDLASAAQIQLYPNPSERMPNLTLASPNPNAHFSVFDLHGRQVASGNLASFNDLMLSPSSYVVQVNSKGETYHAHFILL